MKIWIFIRWLSSVRFICQPGYKPCDLFKCSHWLKYSLQSEYCNFNQWEESNLWQVTWSITRLILKSYRRQPPKLHSLMVRFLYLILNWNRLNTYSVICKSVIHISLISGILYLGLYTSFLSQECTKVKQKLRSYCPNIYTVYSAQVFSFLLLTYYLVVLSPKRNRVIWYNGQSLLYHGIPKYYVVGALRCRKYWELLFPHNSFVFVCNNSLIDQTWMLRTL